MPDQLDTAKKLERLHRAKALEAHKQASKEPDQWIDNGQVLCLDCGNPVGLKRLEAKPDAARCVDCQGIEEARNARYFR